MNILTFDIEEWFHILDNHSTKTINEWQDYESRIHRNMERLFSVLERYNQKATFFCLGWIAENYPETIKAIVEKGHEIGSHTRMHQLIYEQSPQSFKNDLEHSIKTLEDISGQKVKYFRAPGFSIKEKNKWAFDILAEAGIEADFSIFPAPRAHGGFPSYTSPTPSLLSYNGIQLKELPINYTNIMGKPLIFSGGGYFRLFPYSLIKRWTKQSDYVMTYLHPRDFDPDQPVIKDLPLHRKFKSYVGLNSSMHKLEKWLQDFEFVDAGTAIERINWNKVPVVKI
jgi:polysaccharide deacetylase family protein (PEP-CTERM system associated)